MAAIEEVEEEEEERKLRKANIWDEDASPQCHVPARHVSDHILPGREPR